MVKRKWTDDYEPSYTSAKRTRRGTKTRLLDLSDELILRILSFLPVPDLAKCEGVSRQVRTLALDGELWREKFYMTFVRHRAKRIPGIRSLHTTDRNRNALFYASRSAKWLQYTYLNKPGTNWKQSYKIKWNWTRGVARISEKIVSSSNESPLVRVCRGKVYTVDKEHGLRSWRRNEMLHCKSLEGDSQPTSLGICVRGQEFITIVGFSNGAIRLFRSDSDGIFSSVGDILVQNDSKVTAVAISWPYLISVASGKAISLYKLICDSENGNEIVKSGLLTSLKADAEYGSIAVSLRQTNSSVIANIAYTFNRFNIGWCLGLQELKLNHQGDLVDNRVVSAVEELTKKKRTSLLRTTSLPKQTKVISRSTSTEPFILHPQIMCQPTSLSCSGCYILAGLPDNTLMVYTVESTEETLHLTSGRRLWGHTSAVAATEVTSNGQALSISARSDEMRYWELEEIVNSQTTRTSTPIKPWKSVNTAIAARGDEFGLALNDLKRETELTRKWVGFDDEHAVILAERDSRQVLSYFDFA